MVKFTRQDAETLGHKAGFLIKWGTPIQVYGSSQEYLAGKPLYMVNGKNNLKWLLIGAYLKTAIEDTVFWDEGAQTWREMPL